MADKPKRIYVYRCENHCLEMGEADGLFIVDLEGKGPNPHREHPSCPHEACLGKGDFVAVYVPEAIAAKKRKQHGR